MDEMKIEFAFQGNLHDKAFVERVGAKMVPVVRLDAVDQVLAEAVKFAETIVEQYEKNPSRLKYIPLDAQYEAAQAFLASPTIAAFRARQEGKKI